MGEFKDDQLQSHRHKYTHNTYSGDQNGGGHVTGMQSSYTEEPANDNKYKCRTGDVTRGKRKGVKYIIKVL